MAASVCKGAHRRRCATQTLFRAMRKARYDPRVEVSRPLATLPCNAAMQRRELLRAAASAAALAALPRAADTAELIWTRIRARDASALIRKAPGSQQALINALADTIIPRTDTPGATDVQVPAFIDVIVSDYYLDAERVAFTSGLAAIDALAHRMSGAPFASLNGEQRIAVMTALEQPADRNDPATRAYARFKGLVVHGYFTSQQVQRDVLGVSVTPGRFDGSAPLERRVRNGGADV